MRQYLKHTISVCSINIPFWFDIHKHVLWYCKDVNYVVKLWNASLNEELISSKGITKKIISQKQKGYYRPSIWDYRMKKLHSRQLVNNIQYVKICNIFFLKVAECFVRVGFSFFLFCNKGSNKAKTFKKKPKRGELPNIQNLPG